MEVAHERGAEGRVIASFIGVFREHTIEGGSENEPKHSKAAGKMGRRRNCDRKSRRVESAAPVL